MTAALLVALVAFPETHSLLPRVAVGDKFAYDFRAVATVHGKEQPFAARFVMAVASLEPKGTITFKTDRIVADPATGKPGDKVSSTSQTRFRLTGEMLASEPAFGVPEQARFSYLMQIVVPEGRAKVGDSWTWRVPPSAANGQVGLDGRGELLGFEEKEGARCAKLVLKPKETSGDKPASGTLTVWLSLKDGLPIRTEMEFAEMPFAPKVSGRMRATNVRVALGASG